MHTTRHSPTRTSPTRRAAGIFGVIAVFLAVLLGFTTTTAAADTTFADWTTAACATNAAFEDPDDAARAQALAAAGYTCTPLFNKGQLDKAEPHELLLGQLWLMWDGSTLRMRTLLFSGDDPQGDDFKLCLDDDSVPYATLEPCEGNDATLKVDQGDDEGPLDLKLATAPPEETEPDFEVLVRLRTLGTFPVGATDANGWNVHVDGYLHAVLHFNSGEYSVVGFTGRPKNTTVLTTNATATIVTGQTASDVATLTGATTDATGSITFRLYADATCAGAVLFTSTKTVAGNGSYTSDAFQLDTAGTYYWKAEYSGDAKNLGSTHACGIPSEITTVTAPTIVIITEQPVTTTVPPTTTTTVPPTTTTTEPPTTTTTIPELPFTPDPEPAEEPAVIEPEVLPVIHELPFTGSPTGRLVALGLGLLGLGALLVAFGPRRRTT